MSQQPLITLYVDVVSPFAYEAYYILRVSGIPRIGERAWRRFAHTGTSEPLSVINKSSLLTTLTLFCAE